MTKLAPHHRYASPPVTRAENADTVVDDGPPRTTQMGYREFARSITDPRVVSGDEEVFRGRDIAQRNYSPEELVVILDGNAVVVLRRSWWALLPRILLLIVTAVAAAWLTLMSPGSFIGFLPMFSFIPIAVLASVLHGRFNGKYVISSKHLTSVAGLFSWNYLRIRVDYRQLKGVEVAKNLIQRILNVGDIRLSTAMFDQPEVIFRGVHSPQYYATVIRIKQNELQVAPEERGEVVNEGLIEEPALAAPQRRIAHSEREQQP